MAEVSDDASRLWALWLGMLGGPLIWFLQMESSYALLPLACQNNTPALLHVLTVVFLLGAMAIGILGWRNFLHVKRRDGSGLEYFMGMMGMLLSSLFALLIAAQGIPSFFFGPCGG